MAYLAPTPKLGLVLPDPASIQAFETTNVNSNFTLIDTGVGQDRARLAALEGVQPFGQLVRANTVMTSPGGFQVLGAAGWTVQPLGAGMAWNTAANDGFTIPVAGRYRLSGHLTIAATGAPAATAVGQLFFLKNGITVTQSIMYDSRPMLSSRDCVPNLSRVFPLNAGDIIRTAWAHTAGGTVGVWTGADGSWIEIEYVGPTIP